MWVLEIRIDGFYPPNGYPSNIGEDLNCYKLAYTNTYMVGT